MEKLRLSKNALRLFYRIKLLPQVRTLQTSPNTLSSNDDENQNDNKSGPGSTDGLEALLGGMKVKQSEQSETLRRDQKRMLNFHQQKQNEKDSGTGRGASFQETLERTDIDMNRKTKLDFMSALKAKRRKPSQTARHVAESDASSEDVDEEMSEAALQETADFTDGDVIRDRRQNKGRKLTSLQDSFRRARLEKRDKNELAELRIEPELIDAAKSVAQTLPGDVKKTESDLLKQLRSHDEATASGMKGESADFSNLMTGLKVKPRQRKEHQEGMSTALGFDSRYEDSVLMEPATEDWPRDGVPADTGSKVKEAHYRRQRRRSLFDRHRLFIFSPESEKETPLIVDAMVKAQKVPSIWEVEHQKELDALVAIPPRNGFEEMIEWTKEGKLWKYPIDNEQGLEEEQRVGFHEHVFLDHHLKRFPSKGPVRHFMELVITGLSKNPYITVQQKLDHIDWFDRYFKEKEDLLREAGALPEDDRKKLEV